MSIPSTESLAPASPSATITRWHLLTIALLVCGYSGYYFCRSDLSVVMPLLIRELASKGIAAKAAQVRLGSIASLGVLAYAIGKFPSGSMADVLGGRRNFLGGMFGAIVFTLLFMLGGGFPLFTLAWIGNRLFQSLGWAGLVKVASRWFSYSTYGVVMAVLSLSYLFGDAISREIMSVLLDHGMGWRGIFATGAAILAVILVANWLLLRESPEQRGLPAPQVNPMNLYGAGDTAVDEGKTSLPALLAPLVSSAGFWLVCLLSLGTTLLRETFNLWTPTYFTQFVGLTNGQAAGRSALFPLSGGISVIVAGALSDRLGLNGRGLVLFGGLGLGTACLVLLARAPAHAGQLVPVLLVALVGFLLMGPYSYLAGAMAMDFGGERGSGTASGIIDGVGYFAGVLSGDAMARVTVDYGWGNAFLVLAAVALLTTLVSGVLVWRQGRKLPGPATPGPATDDPPTGARAETAR